MYDPLLSNIGISLITEHIQDEVLKQIEGGMVINGWAYFAAYSVLLVTISAVIVVVSA